LISRKRFPMFATIGASAFVIDTLSYFLLWQLHIGSAAIIKFLAYCIAVFYTYMLNRVFTFADVIENRSCSMKPPMLQFGKYFLSQSLGACLNIVVFLAASQVGLATLLSLTIAALAGLIVNYLAARLVFLRSD